MSGLRNTIACAAVVALAATGAWVASGSGAPRPAAAVTRLNAEFGEHGPLERTRATARVLNAAAAVSQRASQAQLAAEGRRLFRSNDLTFTGESCEGCHVAGSTNGTLGTIPHPIEPGDFTGPRDAPTLWGLADTAPYRWTGDIATLPEMALAAMRTHFRPAELADPARAARDVAAMTGYLQTLRAPTTDFDRGTMSPAALRGERLFQDKAGCIACHGGPNFSDGLIHNTLVPKAPGASDPGAAVPPGGFDTPQLRDLRASAPYMHNGTMPTLAAVVDFYNRDSSIAPLFLTDQEKADLVAYLEAL